MRIIIAPAKKMTVDTDSFAVDSLPQFLERTERLKAVLQGMSPKDLQAIWKCNDVIAKLNVERLEQMDLRRNLTPGKVIEKGTKCKMARGQMVRWLAENQIKNLNELRAFDQLGYQFCRSASVGNHTVLQYLLYNKSFGTPIAGKCPYKIHRFREN